MEYFKVVLNVGVYTESDSGKTKTVEEIVKAIRIYEHEVVDGFELTTTFKDCDNTEDFFLAFCKIESIEIPE